MCHEIVATASYSGDIVNVSVAAIAGDKLTVDVRLGTTRRTKITLSCGMVVLLVITGCRLLHILMVLNYYSVSQMYDLVLLGDRLDTV